MHDQVFFRGRKICKHSEPKFQKWAVVTGKAYTVRLIQGSYNKLNDKSAGTHDKGGAADAEGDGFSASVVSTASNQARSCILLAYPRLWKGNWHIHLLDPSCSDLSSAACAQFALFGKGYDALVGNNKDPGSRVYANQIMAAFNNRLVVVSGTTTTLKIVGGVNVNGGSAGVYADSNPNVAGRHTYQFYSADKWKTFKTMDTTNGSSAFEWRFGGKHPVRVIFDPKDTAKYTRSISSGVLVDSAFNLASMDRRIRALEAK
jgi:hypothetical protein